MYVQLGNTHSESQAKGGVRCGASQTLPCDNVQQAVDEWYNMDSIMILLLASSSAVTREQLYNTSNVIINGSLLPHGLRVNPGASRSWLSVGDSTNITIANVNVMMDSGTAVDITSSSDITIEDCVFANPTMNSHALSVLNSYPVTVTRSLFLGPNQKTKPQYNKALNDLFAVRIVVDCASKRTIEGCSSAHSRKIISISKSTFKNLGFLKAYPSWSLFPVARTIVLNISVSNAKGWEVVVHNTTFLSNTSPIDFTVAVDFFNSANNSASLTDCWFEQNSATQGGGFSGTFRNSSQNNSILITNSHFANNSCYEYGGALSFLFKRASIEINQVVISKCTMVGNVAGYVFPLVGGAISAIAQSVQGSSLRTSMNHGNPRISIKNTTFLSNVGSAGAAAFFSGINVDLADM